VGYGDFYPVETAGRMLGNMAMIFGILVFALPLAVIGSTFQAAYERYKTDRMKARRRKKKDTKELMHQMDKVTHHHDQLCSEIEELTMMVHGRHAEGFDRIEGHWKMHQKVMDMSVKSIISSLQDMMDAGLIRGAGPARPSVGTGSKKRASRSNAGAGAAAVAQTRTVSPTVQLSELKE